MATGVNNDSRIHLDEVSGASGDSDGEYMELTDGSNPVSDAASKRFSKNENQGDSSLSGKDVGIEFEGDASKSCCQKAKGCFGSLFSSNKD